MNITPGNNGALFRKLAAMPKVLEYASRMALSRAGLEVQEKAVPWAPVKTGNLWRSITVHMPISKRGREVVIGTNLVYAAIHDKGGYIKAHTQKRTSAFGRPTKPYTVQMPRRYQKARRGIGYLTPAFLIQKRGRLAQIMQEELKAVLRK